MIIVYIIYIIVINAAPKPNHTPQFIRWRKVHSPVFENNNFVFSCGICDAKCFEDKIVTSYIYQPRQEKFYRAFSMSSKYNSKTGTW